MEIKVFEIAFCLCSDYANDPKYTRVIEWWHDCLIAPAVGDTVILDDDERRGYYEVLKREFHNEQSLTIVVKFIKYYYDKH